MRLACEFSLAVYFYPLHVVISSLFDKITVPSTIGLRVMFMAHSWLCHWEEMIDDVKKSESEAGEGRHGNYNTTHVVAFFMLIISIIRKHQKCIC